MPAAIEKDDDPTIPFYPLLEEDGFSASSGKALTGEAVKISDQWGQTRLIL